MTTDFEESRKLPDLTYIKQRIPILEVARELGIHTEPRGGTWTRARCFRPENHKCGDSTPSLNFHTKKNKFMCFACDDRLHSNIDLVMQVEHYGEDLRKVLRWFDEHYPGIPRIKAQKTGRNTFDFRAGVDEFCEPDDLVKAGIVPHLTYSSLRVFTVLAAFRDDNDVSHISYETIKLRTGIRTNATVADAIGDLEKLSIMRVSRNWAKGRAGRDKNQYTFTFDDPALFSILKGRVDSSIKSQTPQKLPDYAGRNSLNQPPTPTPTPKPAPPSEEHIYLGNTCTVATELKPPVVSTALSELKPPGVEVVGCA